LPIAFQVVAGAIIAIVSGEGHAGATQLGVTGKGIEVI
jgi:hypothetical protein